MLEQLRDYLMCRMATRREAASHWVNSVGPRIVKIVEKNKAVARLCHAKWAGGFIFQLSEIPCGHALACVYSRNLNVYDYVDSFYKKESYEKTYGPIIYPMPHLDRWPNPRQNVILPPLFKQMPGRPKKARRREAGEPPAANELRTKARRFNMVMYCRNCKQPCHYYSGYKEPRREGTPIPTPRKPSAKPRAKVATSSTQSSIARMTRSRSCRSAGSGTEP
ncbi:hypothetical protein UlMin_001231 [Ulmus minor]